MRDSCFSPGGPRRTLGALCRGRSEFFTRALEVGLGQERGALGSPSSQPSVFSPGVWVGRPCGNGSAARSVEALCCPLTAGLQLLSLRTQRLDGGPFLPRPTLQSCSSDLT